MGKSTKHNGATVSDQTKTTSGLVHPSKSVDPALAALFSTSLPPAKPTKSSVSEPRRPKVSRHVVTAQDDLSAGSEGSSEAESDAETESEAEFRSDSETTPVAGKSSKAPASRKRKAGGDEDDIEGMYMQRLAREQDLDDERRKRARIEKKMSVEQNSDAGSGGGSEANDDDETSSQEEEFEVPLHESLAPSQPEVELEKASRTVFLANVSTSCIKSKDAHRTLTAHLASFIPELPEKDVPHKIESVRFRSTAFATTSVPRKAAFAKKDLMDATTTSTNAYAVYSTPLAAREAVSKLNGSVVLGRHLRVDGVAHPSKTDHRRCVFVGNLPFVDDESAIRAANDAESGRKTGKARAPADIEEGLWRQFNLAGSVESVRVVRDKMTRVGKGFAYVQFKDANSVEKALLFNEKRYPPLLTRTLRVTRAKNIAKTASHAARDKTMKPTKGKDRIYNPKASSQSQSLAGRAGKLLGRAGAAQHRKSAGDDKPLGVGKTPEEIVFEGHRAHGNQGKGTLKLGKVKKQGKPTTRSSKRGTAFKASGGKKKRS